MKQNIKYDVLTVLFSMLFFTQPALPAIYLKSRTIDAAPDTVQGLTVQRGADNEQHLYLLTCIPPLERSQLDALRGDGLRIISYIPEDTLLVRGTANALNQVFQHDFITWYGPYLAEDKLGTRLVTPSLSPHLHYINIYPYGRALPDPPTLADIPEQLYMISTPAPEDVPNVMDAVQAGGGHVVASQQGTAKGFLRVSIPVSMEERLAARSDVEWIEIYVPPHFENNVAVTSRLMNVQTVWNDHGLTGAGQIIGHADTGLQTGETNNLGPDFNGRLIAGFGIGRTNDWSDPQGHGTHTAGSILGNGANSDGLFRGTAYEAKLVHQSLLNAENGVTIPVDLNDLFQPCYDLGARIHSDSWGDDTRGYLLETYQIDEFVWNHPDLLPVFSAGNAGIDANRDGIVDPGQIGFIAEAKNTLVVGAAETWRTTESAGGFFSYDMNMAFMPTFPTRPIADDPMDWPFDNAHPGMAAFSTRGPCVDGRIKPDIVTPGMDIISCRTMLAPPPKEDDIKGDISTLSLASNYVAMSGTSMSCPLTAGAASLVRQFYAQHTACTNPSAALVKATLLAGADTLFPGQYGSAYAPEVPTPRPNSVEGWGMINLEQSLFPGENLSRNFHDVSNSNGLATGDAHTYTFTVSNTCMVSVVLTWSDYPAQPEAAGSLVNNLDLLLTAPDGTRHYPNHLTGPDHINNVESIDISCAATGTWTLSISGASIPTYPIFGIAQGYALVALQRTTPDPEPAVLASAVAPHDVTDEIIPKIVANIRCNTDRLNQVTLRYRIGSNTWTTLSMINAGDGVFERELVAFETNDRVEYQVSLTETNGQVHTGQIGYFYCRPVHFDVYTDTVSVPADELMTNVTANLPLAVTMDYAPAGSELILHSGMHFSPFGMLIGKPMTLRGSDWPPTAQIAGVFGRALTVKADVLIERIAFQRGMTSKYGGLLSMKNGVLRNCILTGGTAARGGAIYADGTQVESCLITGNTAKQAGGGAASIGTATFTHCLITSNTASEAAGVLAEDATTLTFCTIAGNTATNGSALDLEDQSSLLHSIYYDNITLTNTPPTISANATLSNSCMDCLPVFQHSGWHYFTNDPALTHDGHLTANSPCIDRAPTFDEYDVDHETVWDSPLVTNTCGPADIGGDEWTDHDLDLLADFWEIEYFNTLQQNPDSDPDGDLLLNTDEYLCSTCPTNFDTDGDNYSDYSEFIAGTDPLDPASLLAFTGIHFSSGTNITFEWASVTNRTYDLLYKTSADTPEAWSNILTDITATPPANTCNISPIPTGGVYAIQVNDAP